MEGSSADKITLLLMDCDGVLTDGRLYLGANGEELKVFHARDGQGIVDWHAAGFRSGIISGRNSPIVATRARQLGIEFVWRFEEGGDRREIRTDTGWGVRIGRGLDIYQRSDSWMQIGASNFNVRPCMETKVSVRRLP